MRFITGPTRLIDQARALRRNMTEAEHVLWRELRNKQLGVRFRRQEPVSGYIVDFYAPSVMLAVEVDGEVHDDRTHEDRARDARLGELNVTVIRFANDAVINDLPVVLDAIVAAVRARCAAPLVTVSRRSYLPRAPSERGGQGGASTPPTDD